MLLAALGAAMCVRTQSQRAREQPLPPGAYTIRVPDFFDCTGPAFPPVWDEFYGVVMEFERELQKIPTTAQGLHHVSPELHAVGSKVAHISHNLLQEWFDRLSGVNGTGLDKVIRGYLPKESLDGVCYYGLVQCLWIRAQVLLMQSESRFAEAMMELKTAMQIIGEDFRGDYIESTRWPVSSLEIQQTLQHQRLTKIPNFQQSISIPTTLGPYAITTGSDFYNAEQHENLETRDLHVAAFGSHVALLSEPMTMIRGAFPEWRVIGHWFLTQCRWRDPLHHYLCQLNCMLIGECAFDESSSNLGRRILSLVEFAAEGVGEPEVYAEQATFENMLDLTAELWDNDMVLRSSQFAICVIPLMCSLLRAATPLPLLGYFSMGHYTAPLPGLGDWGMMHFAEMAKNPRQNVFAFSCKLLAELGAYQLGVLVPVVRPFGLYAYRNAALSLFPNPFAQLDPNTGNFNRTILVPRSWLIQETSFLHSLRAFIDMVEPEFPLNFTVVRSLTHADGGDPNWSVNPSPAGKRLGETLGQPQNVFLDSRTVLMYRAAILLPQLPNMMSLYELHSMHLPTFMPGRGWLYRLFHQRRWSVVGQFQQKKVRPMKPPMFNTDIWSTNDSFKHWLFLYDRRFETSMPGIQIFESIPDLLHSLLFMDLEEVRERMRQYNEKSFEPVLRWYRSAALNLLMLLDTAA